MKTVETYKLTTDIGQILTQKGVLEMTVTMITVDSVLCLSRTFPRVPPGEKPPVTPGDIASILPVPGPYSPSVSGKSHKSH